jgi:hypothetical protein
MILQYRDTNLDYDVMASIGPKLVDLFGISLHHNRM